MTRRKQPLITRLLYLAVFGKEDLMHTIPARRTRGPGFNHVTRGKAS